MPTPTPIAISEHEATFFKQMSDQLDEFLNRGRDVLGDLGQQRDMLKGTQKRMYSAANTLGIMSALGCPTLHLIFHPNYMSLAYRG
jgi:hypothetical protein